MSKNLVLLNPCFFDQLLRDEIACKPAVVAETKDYVAKFSAWSFYWYAAKSNIHKK